MQDASKQIVGALQDVLGDKYDEIMERFRKKINYSPVIVFLGKTGAGKSSLCNALFGEELFKVDDVEACTSTVQVESFTDGKLTLVDVPGIGEDITNSAKYKKLYKRMLQKGIFDERKNHHDVDAYIWLIKSDDRALEIDLEFYNDVFKNNMKAEQRERIVFAISQADKIEPIRGEGSWDENEERPGTKQSTNLNRKRDLVSRYFNQESNHVVEFSATENYNLDKLFERIVSVLPVGRRPLVIEIAKETNPSTVSPTTDKKGKESFFDVLGDLVEPFFPAAKPILKIAKGLFKGIKKFFKLF